MELEIINTLLVAGRDYGAYGILMILSGALWWKLEGKDKVIYELIGVIKENTNNQKQIIDRLKEVNENIIKSLTK